MIWRNYISITQYEQRWNHYIYMILAPFSLLHNLNFIDYMICICIPFKYFLMDVAGWSYLLSFCFPVLQWLKSWSLHFSDTCSYSSRCDLDLIKQVHSHEHWEAEVISMSLMLFLLASGVMYGFLQQHHGWPATWVSWWRTWGIYSPGGDQA